MKVNDVYAALESGDQSIVDVRTPAEVESSSMEGSVNVPLDQVKSHAFIKELSVESEIILVCRSGQRAGMAQKELKALGFMQTSVMEGGMQAWEKAGLPVRKGKQTISLERQVRIAAGFLVVLGTALGWSVNSGFYGIPAFVGAGLMFAGITDTCAMGMMIAKIPWNSGPPPSCTLK